jgi:endonuclease/exonuclease/phosphatase family metal-dependent hydrolase
MKLISWNVARWTGRTDREAEAVLARQPDALVLKEVTRSSAADWSGCSAKGRMAWSTSWRARDLVREERQYTELTRSRFPLTRIDPHGFDVERPERALSVRLDAPAARRAPDDRMRRGISTKWEKIARLKAVHGCPAVAPTPPRVLCGDFNRRRAERRSGTVITWA